ncbi:hypothetical protein GEMRC1_013241 [Eukaryota sp. GEM-RC1]
MSLKIYFKKLVEIYWVGNSVTRPLQLPLRVEHSAQDRLPNQLLLQSFCPRTDPLLYLCPTLTVTIHVSWILLVGEIDQAEASTSFYHLDRPSIPRNRSRIDIRDGFVMDRTSSLNSDRSTRTSTEASARNSQSRSQK